METRDFLDLFVKKGGRTVGGKVHGWKHDTFKGLAGLTSYLAFNCNFNKDGLCKVRQSNNVFDNVDEKAQMCCCGGCRPCIGFHYQMSPDYSVIEFYAQHFDEKTGFWRKGTGCVLPRSHRSSTCLTYNCDRNTCRPDSHKHLLKCLKRKNDNMTVDGKRSTEYHIVADLREWLRRKPTYKTAKGSIDYAP